MLRHLLDVHEEEEEHWDQIKFSMKILRSTRTAFKRQILESVLIQKERKGHYLMNAKSEYNRCALPRLTAKLGERELASWRKQDKLEQEKEATIEEKIRMRKKAKAKDRGTADRRRDQDQPARKKRRVEKDGPGETAMGTEEEEVRRKEIPALTPQKRKEEGEEEKGGRPPKKRFKKMDMRGYISCKRWKLAEEEAVPGQGQQHQGGGHDHQHHPQPPEGGGDKAVIPAGTDRMPCPIVKASPGGTCPGTEISVIESNDLMIEDTDSQQRSRETTEEEDTQGDCLGEDLHQGGAGDHHHHHLQHQPHPPEPVHEGVGDKAVPPACANRMPCPIVRASPGGICPGTVKVTLESKVTIVEELASQPANQPTVLEREATGGHQHHLQGAAEEEHQLQQPPDAEQEIAVDTAWDLSKDSNSNVSI